MANSNDFLKDVLNAIFDGVYFVDRNRTITFWNKAAERITGYSAAEVLGSRCADRILVHVDENGTALCLGPCPLSQSLSDGKAHLATVYLHHKSGHRVPVSVHVYPITDREGKIVGAAEIFRECSSRLVDEQTIEDLRKAALLDPLTGLANRRYAEMKLRASFEDMRRNNIFFGVIFADIDHFKNINDVYGHRLGDDVLKMVARTLEGNIRAYDLVGRWGGEEFLVVITHTDEARLAKLANKLRIFVEKCFLSLNRTTVSVTITMGATMARPDDNIESLVQRADTLLYKGKNSGRNCIITS